MKIKIVKQEEDTVIAKSKYGIFKAVWCSSELGKKNCFVELDSSDVITPQDINLVSYGSSYAIEHYHQGVCITGYVEEIEGGIMVLRIGTSLMMLSLSPECDYANFKQNYVKVRLNNIKLYDMGL